MAWEPSRERIHIRTLGKFGISSSSKVPWVWGYVIVTRRVGVIGLIHVVNGSFRVPHPPLPGGSPYSLFSPSFVPQGLNFIRGNMAAAGGVGPLNSYDYLWWLIFLSWGFTECSRLTRNEAGWAFDMTTTWVTKTPIVFDTPNGPKEWWFDLYSGILPENDPTLQLTWMDLRL